MRPRLILHCGLWILIAIMATQLLYFIIHMLFRWDGLGHHSNDDVSSSHSGSDLYHFAFSHAETASSQEDVSRWNEYLHQFQHIQVPLSNMNHKLNKASEPVHLRKSYHNVPKSSMTNQNMLDLLKEATNLLNGSFSSFAFENDYSFNLPLSHIEQLHFLNGTVERVHLYAALHLLNARQIILNADLYNETEFVIIIQVHDRLEYLRLLVESLHRSKDIHRTLLVFSHDMYDLSINQLVRSIRFCKVLQIFFPYSQQLFTSTFPGKSPDDCSPNLKPREAKSLKCNNHLWPDMYGHFRDASYCQTKHHWFWKISFLFDRIRYLQEIKYSSTYLFLEEDHYVVEDFLHMLRLMREFQEKSYPDEVSILCLGTYEKRIAFKPSANKVQIGKWVSSFHNMGMALDRKQWLRIRSCSEQFCNFDDYNWDWSLYHINNAKCISPNFKVMLLSKAPRVFHIGECGVHHKKRLCSPRSRVRAIDSMLANEVLETLYPPKLEMLGHNTFLTRVLKPNGGWGDERDRKLCQSYVANISEIPSRQLVNEEYLKHEMDVKIS